MKIKNFVKVMNFHSLLKVDNAKAKADELRNSNINQNTNEMQQRQIQNENIDEGGEIQNG